MCNERTPETVKAKIRDMYQRRKEHADAEILALAEKFLPYTDMSPTSLVQHKAMHRQLWDEVMQESGHQILSPVELDEATYLYLFEGEDVGYNECGDIWIEVMTAADEAKFTPLINLFKELKETGL